jgi:bifunctional DNase/RNase
MRAVVLALLVACATAPPPAPVVAKPVEATPDPVTKPAGYVEMRVLDVIGMGDGDTLLLVDDVSNLVVPIVIGGTEGMAIVGRVRGVPPRRPLTHDLMDDAVKRLGGTIVKVHIDELRDGIFHGSVYIRNAKGRIVRLDSRASDAVALGIGNGVPIYVAQRVLDETGLDRDKVMPQVTPSGPMT